MKTETEKILKNGIYSCIIVLALVSIMFLQCGLLFEMIFIGRIPIFFLVVLGLGGFFAGAAIYWILSHFLKKYITILTIVFTVLLIFFIFWDTIDLLCTPIYGLAGFIE